MCLNKLMSLLIDKYRLDSDEVLSDESEFSSNY